MKTAVHPEFRALRAARDRGEPLDELWAAFASKVQAGAKQPPHLVAELLRNIEEVQAQRDPAEIRILDHGCGGGFIVLYLTALGYTQTFGVDVGDPNKQNWNTLLRKIVGDDLLRTCVYDGHVLPFPDGSFDVVYSTQVIDHVDPAVWDSYFSEEGRVLKAGGCAFHEAPHRLAPYDSHTRTWLFHYLPRTVHWRLYRIIGRGGPETHYLRYPWQIAAALKRHVGPSVVNHAMSAFTKSQRDAYFDGPTRIRGVVLRATRIPVLGKLVQWALQPFLMLRASAGKRPSDGP